MSTHYHKVGTTLRDSFFYIDRASFDGVNGKVQGDFTIEISKNSTGGQATTGVTITEVSATNNDGEYHLEVSGTTGFVSATGEYSVRIYDTASPEYNWGMTYIVTSDGTGAGTVGAASFTATSGDGRVTDGTSALNAASVYVRNSSNVLVTSTTTNASGVWGPVFLDNGTYTVYAQKSGYSVASGTITVTAGVAAGPGADIALTAVSVGTGLTLGELMSYGRRMMRDSPGSKADADLKSAVNDALGMIARARSWPWFLTQGNLSLVASQNGTDTSSTIAVTSGSTTVTLTGTTWPSWAASGQIEINNQWHDIATRSSNTVILLTTAYAGATASGLDYEIFQDEYSLPSDCLRFHEIFPGPGWIWQGSPATYRDVLNAKNSGIYGQKFPELWAIYKDKFVLWPAPNTAINLPILYDRRPATLTTSTDEADWDPCNLEVLQRAIDYQIAIRYQNAVCGNPEACLARYEAAMARATGSDKSPTTIRGGLSGFGTVRVRPTVVP